MAGQDDGDDIFSRFDKLFGGNMDDQFRDMTKRFEEMFQNMGFSNIVIHEGPPHPGLPEGVGRLPAPQDPRDQMLKNPEKGQCQPKSETAQHENPNVPFGFHGRFEFPPFERPDSGRPDVGDRLSPQDIQSSPIQSSSYVSSWSSSSTTGDGSRWNKSVTRTTRHPDGTVEKIETHTQNGQTCTTTTRTVPYGVTSSNTVCDKPAIDGPPLKDNNSPGPTTPLGPPVKPYQPKNSGYSEDDNSFFRKLFGFKPKE